MHPRPILFSLLFLWSLTCSAADVLELRIDVDFNHTPIQQVLDEIAQKGNFEWSYNTNILNQKNRITYHAYQSTIREILHGILGANYEFKQNGEYIILKKLKKEKEKVIGYIKDQETGTGVPNVTVYDPTTLKSTETDDQGYYELPVKRNSKIIVSKLSFKDTAFVVSNTDSFLTIGLRQDSLVYTPPGQHVVKETLHEISDFINDIFKTTKRKSKEINVKDSLHRTFQLSLLPSIGTNLLMSSTVTNDYSINLLAGYSNGNNILEVAGIGNINRHHMTGVQAASWFNITGSNAYGMQIAGLYNQVEDTLSGVQAAGLQNRVYGVAQGLQLAGFKNKSNRGAGLWQVAGFKNRVMQGATIAQIAGYKNVSDTVKGLQLAGWINKAKVVKGIQIGIINKAKEVQGVQLGLLNFSKKGRYIGLEATWNELFPFNLSFKSGTHSLHTIFSFSSDLNPVAADSYWALGAGFGTRIPSSRAIGLAIDAKYQVLNQGESTFNFSQNWIRTFVGVDVRLGRLLGFNIGPAANLLVGSTTSIQDKIIPESFPRFSLSSEVLGWVGAQTSVRLMF